MNHCDSYTGCSGSGNRLVWRAACGGRGHHHAHVRESFADGGTRDEPGARRFHGFEHQLAGMDFSATVNWGDGTETMASVASTGAPGEFSLSGSHTYVEEGSYMRNFHRLDSGASANVSDNVTLPMPLSSTEPGRFLRGGGVSSTAKWQLQDSNPSGTVPISARP